MRPLDLGGDERDVGAAIDLAHRREVLIRVARKSPEYVRLLDAGFAPIVSDFHCLHMLDKGRLSRRSRRRRKEISAQLDIWRSMDILLHVEAGAQAEERLVEDFYYPLLVPRLYARGESPYGVHNERTFRMLARRSIAVMAIRNSSPVGCALFQVEDLRSTRGMSPDGLDLSTVMVGKVYAVHPTLLLVNRAWLFLLGEALLRAGWSIMSMGGDTGWIDEGYLPIVLDKLSWCDALVWTAGAVVPMYGVPCAATQATVGAPAGTVSPGILICESEGGSLLVRGRGIGEDPVATLVQRMSFSGLMEISTHGD